MQRPSLVQEPAGVSGRTLKFVLSRAAGFCRRQMQANPALSVVDAARSVHVTVGNLFLGRVTHVGDFHLESQ